MVFQKIKQINWMEMSGLMVGVISTVAIMIFSLAFYHYLNDSNILNKDEYTLHSKFEKALGLKQGTRVQISGVDVGRISDMKIDFQGDSTAVYMEFAIEKKYQSLITDSATVYAIRDQNLISSRVINIDIKKEKGSVKGRVLEEGDFIQAGPAQDIETVIETANQILGRVNNLIDAADNLVAMALDTGTTMGALFGSRALYDNLNRQLYRLDDITYLGKSVLNKTSFMLDTMKKDLPQLVNRANEVTISVGNMIEDLKPLPNQVTSLLNSMDSTVNRVDNLVNDFGTVTSGLQDFINTTESTLQSADDLMNGMSQMWLFRNNIPKHDSVPFAEETLW